MMRILPALSAISLLSLRSFFSGKRGWGSALFIWLPPLLALVIGLTARHDFDAEWLMNTISLRMVLGLYLLLLALMQGLSISSTDIEEGTSAYLYSGLLPRWGVLFTRFLVTWGLLSLLTLVSLCLVGVISAVTRGAEDFLYLQELALRYSLPASIGLACHLAFFIFCGFAFRRPATVALILSILWEVVVSFMMPIKFAAYTVTNNLYAISLTVILGGEKGRWFRHVRNYELLEYGDAILFLMVLLALFLLGGMVALERRPLMGRESG
jgi:ABC-type transport system involved in multi-copper enzyme maturation permease subunit